MSKLMSDDELVASLRESFLETLNKLKKEGRIGNQRLLVDVTISFLAPKPPQDVAESFRKHTPN